MTNIDRRTFLAAAGITRSCRASLFGPSDSSFSPLNHGNGEWTYAVVSGWGTLPSGTTFGGTHGAIAQDKAGNIYVSTQSDTGVLVYSPEGRC